MTGFCRPPWRLSPDLRGSATVETESIKGSLQRAIAKAPHDLLILSCETLSRFRRDELKDLINFLACQALSLEAAAYIRDYRSWCESLFQQSAKYGTWHQGLFPHGHGAYRQAVEKFDQLLGTTNVRLWKYDREKFPGKCVVRDFYQRLELDPYHTPSPELNRSLGLEASKLLMAYHESGLGAVHDRATFGKNVLLAKHLLEMPDQPVKFHEELIRERLLGEAEDIRWIEGRLGESVHMATSGETGGNSIRSQDDLRRFSDQALDWLGAESGYPIRNQGPPVETAMEVAKAMAALRDKVSLSAPKETGKRSSSALPKIIWMFWSQGFSAAPPLVETCVASWRQQNPGWDIRLLDEAGAEPYLRRAKISWVRLQALPQEKRANILRMRLLAEEGGVWTDAATLCLQPLDDWLPQSMDAGLFVFHDPAYFLMVTNWFIASEKSGRLAELWRDAHEEFWAAKDYLHHSSYPGKPAPELPAVQSQLLMLFHRLFDRSKRSTDWWFHPLVGKVLRTYPYCVMHYIYAREYRRNPEWRQLADRMAYKDAKPCTDHYLKGGEQKTLSELIAMGSKKHAPILKLKWDRPPLLDT